MTAGKLPADQHTHEFIGRVVRTPLPGSETGEQLISLELICDLDTVEIHEGDEFVTLLMAVDPFDGQPPRP